MTQDNEGWIGPLTADNVREVRESVPHMTPCQMIDRDGVILTGMWNYTIGIHPEYKYRLLCPAYERDALAKRVEELEAKATQAHAQGYNEAIKKASEIVYFAGDDLALSLNEGEAVTVEYCEKIIQDCWQEIFALKKGG